MMSDVSFSGNVVGDPVVQRVNGKALVKLRVALKDRVRTDSGEWVDAETVFMDVVCWADFGLNVAGSVRKGQRVVVRGERKTRQFTRKDGTPGEAVEVTAKDLGVSVMFGKSVFTPAGRRGSGESGLAAISDILGAEPVDPGKDPWDF